MLKWMDARAAAAGLLPARESTSNACVVCVSVCFPHHRGGSKIGGCYGRGRPGPKWRPPGAEGEGVPQPKWSALEPPGEGPTTAPSPPPQMRNGALLVLPAPGHPESGADGLPHIAFAVFSCLWYPTENSVIAPLFTRQAAATAAPHSSYAVDTRIDIADR